MEETIDLREYFAIIKKRCWIIALIATIAIIVSATISFFVLKPIYQANTTLMVETNTDGSTITSDQFAASQKLAVTYGEIIKSRTVLEPVIEKLKIDMTYEELSQAVSVSPVKDTQIIKISVEDTDANRARDIANQIPKISTATVKRIIKANSVELVDEAILPEDPIKPNKLMNVAISAVLGIMIGLFVVFLLEYMDNKMKTPQDIEKHLGLPILGVIPKEKAK